MPVGPTNPKPPAGQGPYKGGWAFLVAIIIAVLMAISRCSTPPPPAFNTTSTSEDQPAQTAMATAIQAQQPPAMEPLSRASVRRGRRDLSAAAVEGLPGEMIYSQNCYDTLGRTFTWAKLDTCGAFDAAAAAALDENDSSLPAKEASWFQSEAAAERYLKAATSAGGDPDKASERLSGVLEEISKLSKPRPDAASLPNEVGGSEGTTSSSAESMQTNGTSVKPT